MKSYINEWNEAGLEPVSKTDKLAIEDAEDQEIELRVDDQLRVFNEANIYIADLKEIK